MSRPVSSTPTDWELKLLNILWQHGRCSVDDVREHLRGEGHKRSDSAVRKMLLVLVEKGLAVSETEGRTSFYRAAVKQAKVEKSVFRHVIETLFGGDEEVFLLRAMDETKITPDLLKKMKEKLQEQDGDEPKS